MPFTVISKDTIHQRAKLINICWYFTKTIEGKEGNKIRTQEDMYMKTTYYKIDISQINFSYMQNCNCIFFKKLVEFILKFIWENKN